MLVTSCPSSQHHMLEDFNSEIFALCSEYSGLSIITAVEETQF